MPFFLLLSFITFVSFSSFLLLKYDLPYIFPSFFFFFFSVKCVIFDEADRLLELGFLEQVLIN